MQTMFNEKEAIEFMGITQEEFNKAINSKRLRGYKGADESMRFPREYLVRYMKGVGRRPT